MISCFVVDELSSSNQRLLVLPKGDAVLFCLRRYPLRLFMVGLGAQTGAKSSVFINLFQWILVLDKPQGSTFHLHLLPFHRLTVA